MRGIFRTTTKLATKERKEIVFVVVYCRLNGCLNAVFMYSGGVGEGLRFSFLLHCTLARVFTFLFDIILIIHFLFTPIRLLSVILKS